ncbi:MAG: ISKra4 family transposase [Gammaproteobacteria bacterium]|nr:ISKra4 family transposase [Gammaproteobacteria bacterium]
MKKLQYFSAAEEKFGEMRNFLQSSASQRLELSGLEEYLVKEGRELFRQLLAAHIAERGVGDLGASVVGADGVARTYKRRRNRTITTLFGAIVIRRLGYSPRRGTSLFPLDAMLNLPTIKTSYTLQKHLVLEVIKSSFDEALEAVVRWTGITIPKAQAYDIIEDAARDFSAFYAEQYTQEHADAQALPLLVLTSDGKGVLVRTEDLREATRQRALAQLPKPRGDVSKTKRLHARRMATVASVYEIARFPRTPDDILGLFFSNDPPDTRLQRPRPTAKRLWASLKQSSPEVITALFEDAVHRDAHQQKEWVVLVDGDPNQIKIFERLARTFKVSLTIICDIVHVLGYLWKAGKVLQDKDHVALWVRDRFARILQGKSSGVASGMRRSATCRHLSASDREPLDDCARYLLNHAPYLAYHEYLKQGYPIATGVIEGACRYLVKDRMEITGARWSLEGAEAVLQLRAIKLSGDFPRYWTFHEQQQYRRNYATLYQNPSVLSKDTRDS